MVKHIPRFGYRAAIALGLALAAVTPVRAQIPHTVLAARFHSWKQTGSTAVEPDGAGFGISVQFSGTLAPGTAVRLRHPSGEFTEVPRESGGLHSVEREFATADDAAAAYPGGLYAVMVSGSRPSTTEFVLSDVDVPPTRLVNFNSLQAWPTERPTLRWEPIVGANRDDLAIVELQDPSGREVFATPGTFDPRTNSLTTSALEFGLIYSGYISYFRMASSLENAGATRVAAGTAFRLGFPVSAVLPAPEIVRQPESIAVQPGAGADFSVVVSPAGGLSYQWRKDGVPLPGATAGRLALSAVRPGDEGSYSVEVRASGGSVASEPALLKLAPSLQPLVYSGSIGIPGFRDGAAADARFHAPFGLAADARGTVYVADSGNHTVRRIGSDGMVTTLAGSPGQSGAADGIGTAARFSAPLGIAADAFGNVFVSDGGNHTIRRISPAGVVTTLAGTPGQPGHGDGVAGNARFSNPDGLAVGADGTLFVADHGNHRICAVTPAGAVSTVAGGLEKRGFADGVATTARFFAPRGLAVGPGGILFVADTGNRAIRTISPNGVVGTRFVAQSGVNWIGLAVDRRGFVYAGDPFGGILQLGPGGSVAGLTNALLYGRFPGVEPNHRFAPAGIASDANGLLYIADVYSHVVLKAAVDSGSREHGISILSAPQPHVAAVGDHALLEVEARGPSLLYRWYRDGRVIPDATERQLFLRSGSVSDSGRYSVQVFNSLGAVDSPGVDVAFRPTQDVGRLVNLSVRAQAGPGARTLIAGFVVAEGRTAGDQPLLVRGIGPGLAGFGIAGAMADPEMTIYRGALVVAGNDNWGGGLALRAEFGEAGAFPLVSGSADAAMVGLLAPGAYTAQLAGKRGSGGVALAEIYDRGTGAAPPGARRLVNLSARVHVGVGSDILVAGFTIGGSTSKTILLRAVGEGLGGFGVADHIPDTRLQLFRGDRAIATSDSASPAAYLAGNAVGAFGLAPTDAAMLVTLAPGAYTVQVRGSDNRDGIALVELYEHP